ncbi:MAG: AAA family ATPase [Actinomycetota bacterium]
MNDPAEDQPSAPAVRETHISTVFFTADRAYKLLKPVRTSFLDHSTTAQRLQAADEEVRLNRRLAPDVYLGTADVVEEGELVDRMIVMRRLPAHQRLVARLGRAAVDDDLRAIARTVAAFHAAQIPAPDAPEIAGAEAVAANWADNFGDLALVRGSVLADDAFDRARHLVERYIEHRSDLFEARIAGGFVRDGHGDLTAEDIFCTERGPRILDCLAFDRRLRVADVLADVAFLAMDIERLDQWSTARRFLDWYTEFTNEHHPSSLADHYVAYRAHVRAKVASIRHRQGDPDAAALVNEYHRLCLRHLERGQVRLVLVGGTPGSGKTTLAQALSGPLSAMTLTTDELRKDLAGRGHLDRAFDRPDEGLYHPDMTARTYAELLRRAGTLLRLGQSVILDASWSKDSLRHDARSLARRSGAELTELRCVLDPAEAARRVAQRLARADDPSDARPELLDELAADFEPWPTATEIDTGGSVPSMVTTAMGLFNAPDPVPSPPG